MTRDDAIAFFDSGKDALAIYKEKEAEDDTTFLQLRKWQTQWKRKQKKLEANSNFGKTGEGISGDNDSVTYTSPIEGVVEDEYTDDENAEPQPIGEIKPEKVKRGRKTKVKDDDDSTVSEQVVALIIAFCFDAYAFVKHDERWKLTDEDKELLGFPKDISPTQSFSDTTKLIPKPIGNALNTLAAPLIFFIALLMLLSEKQKRINQKEIPRKDATRTTIQQQPVQTSNEQPKGQNNGIVTNAEQRVTEGTTGIPEPESLRTIFEQ